MMIHVPGGTERDSQDFIMLFRMAHNKFGNCFWNFMFHIFEPWLTTGNDNCVKRNHR